MIYKLVKNKETINSGYYFLFGPEYRSLKLKKKKNTDSQPSFSVFHLKNSNATTKIVKELLCKAPFQGALAS